MSLTLLYSLLIVASIAMSGLLVLALRSRGSRRDQLDLETCKARLEDIGAQLKLGKLSEAEADAARLALLAGPRPSRLEFGLPLQGVAGRLIAPAAVFLLVAGIGAATSYVGDTAGTTNSEDANSSSQSPSGQGDEMLARLTDYTRSIGPANSASIASTPTASAGKLLPDVSTMIERLEARLETAPKDIKGWRMLGWSYFQTARYEQAAAAYAKALELDPSSAELKLAYDEAKSKAAGGDKSEAVSSFRSEATGGGSDGPSGEKTTTSEAMSPRERDAAIRSMVDGLADRLESSPRDAEGWTRLMRSRIVLGEREVAATAFRKALEVFKDDSGASARITATAIELGLKSE